MVSFIHLSISTMLFFMIFELDFVSLSFSSSFLLCLSIIIRLISCLQRHYYKDVRYDVLSVIYVLYVISMIFLYLIWLNCDGFTTIPDRIIQCWFFMSLLMLFIVLGIFFYLALIKGIHLLLSFILYAARNVIPLLWRIFILDLILAILIFDSLFMTVIFICGIGFVLAFDSTY